MKKMVSVALTFLFAIGCLAIPSVVADTVVEISTAEQLSNIRNDLDGNYRLVNDIIFTPADFAEGGAFYNDGAGWDPIGRSYTATTAFTGVLDGNGYTISGLYINVVGNGNDAKFAGLFGHMNGTVKDLALDNVDITTTNIKSARAGAVAGQSQGTVENVSADGRVQCMSGTNTTAVGGLVGRQTKTAIVSGCYADVDVTATGNTIRIGGIAGENEGGVVQVCQTTGKIEASALYTLYIGGVVGHSHAASSGSAVSPASVTNCLRDGETVGFAKSSTVGGGIVGWNQDSTVNMCVTLQTISLTGDTGVTIGQTIGDNEDGNVTNLYYVQHDSEIPVIGGGSSGTATKLVADFTEGDVSGLLNAGEFWVYKNGTLQLNELPSQPSLRENTYIYTVNADGQTATLVGYTGNVQDVTIPVQVNGFTVSAIGESVFAGEVIDDSIGYDGTSSQWATITVAADNAALTGATVLCLGDLRFASASLTLYNNIAINYKVDKALFEQQGYENPYVRFELNGQESIATEYTVVGDRYVFDFKDIAPDQMNDIIYATLYVTYNDVEYTGETKEYSVETYCYSMLEKYADDEHAAFRTLLVDLLTYGAQSQIYTNTDVDDLADASLTETQRLWGTAVSPALQTVLDVSYQTVENPTATWKGAGLNLKDSVTMRFKFATENVEGLQVKVTNETGDEWWILNDTFEMAGEGIYYAFFGGLHAAQMRESVYVTVYNGDVAVSNTLRYSIESYAYAKQDNDDPKLSHLLDAMMKYGDSAEIYAATLVGK